MAAIEVIDISDSENEEEEKYITIFYQDSSKFIEFPVDDDGNLLLIDIKSIEPNIIGLYLSKGNIGKLLKPKNGFFKEPKEGWENFKVFAVLKELENVVDLTVSSHKNTARPKSVFDELPSNIYGDVETEKSMKETSPHSEQFHEDTSASFSAAPNSAENKDNAAQSEIYIDSKDADDQNFSVCHISAFNPLKQLHEDIAASLSSASTSNGTKNKDSDESETVHSEIDVAGDDTDDRIFSTYSISSYEEFIQLREGTWAPTSNKDSNKVVPSDTPAAVEITDEEIFSAYKVSSYDELKELLCQRNPLFHKCFETTFNRFKRTMLAYPNSEIVQILHYAFRTYFPFNKLDPNAAAFCKLCDRNMCVNHVISKNHVENYQLKFNADPPEIAVLLDPKCYRYFFFKAFDYLVNRFYPKQQFDIVKDYLIRRIVDANLILPSQDPLFVEKLIFLRSNFMQHPTLKYIFLAYEVCYSCDNYCTLNTFSNVVSHVLSKKHIVSSLTQEELNKMHQAFSCIHHSDTGFYYSHVSIGNRKRPAREIVEEYEKRHKMQCIFNV